MGLPLRSALGLCLALSLTAFASTARAALVQLCGPTVCYEFDNNAGVNTGITYYGLPTLLAGSDTIKFSPTQFSVDSDPGTAAIPGPTLTAVFAFTRVWSLYGMEIGSIDVSESGDYQVLGDATVAANLRVQVVDLVDDWSPTPGFPEQIVDNQLFSTSTPTGLPLANWSLASSVSPSAVFTDLATSVDLSIQNTLQAFEGPGGGYGFIAKKLLLTVSTTGSLPPENVVPVPAAVWFMGSALGLLGFARRRAG
jgi:hypothetical protein